MRDPAPSRLAYRLNRLMLTRGVRSFLRYGLPVLLLLAGVAIWASDPDRRQDAADRVAELRRQIEERPEFMVRMMAIDNASEPVAEDIRAALPIDFPISSFDLDLDALRASVEKLDAVAGASVRIRSGGVLAVEVQERMPAVVWRSDDALVLLDAIGHRVAPVEARDLHPDLPLIVGKGANAQVPEALQLIAAASSVAPRIRGLVRVGERRWDVVLDRDQRIMLPERSALNAMERVMALDTAQDLLARDIARIDFRNPRRPVLRLTTSAIEAFYDTDWTIDEDMLR